MMDLYLQIELTSSDFFAAGCCLVIRYFEEVLRVYYKYHLLNRTTDQFSFGNIES